jgi:UDP-GlcNAc:undecaprenyl-phosphate/decaprenyl-phosphate GlcNAc-1-phosphate transferase
MLSAAVTFAIALAVGVILTPVTRDLAHRADLLDHALSSRKVHVRPVPRLGGVAIVLAFFAPLVGLLFVKSEVGQLFVADPRHALGLFLGGASIAVLGVYDDLKSADAKLKFLVQFAVGGLVYSLGFRIDVVANPLGAPIHLGWLGLPFTLLWIAGVINAINLIDGLDGLAGGVAFISVGVTFVAALMHGEPLMALVSAALAGAILGFLRYNFNPATIFMGDTGSMFLGFVLATTSIKSHHKASTAVAIIVPVIALGLPITDTLLAMARRALRGAPLFQADRDHIHHRLLQMGLTHRQVVLVLYGASVVLGAMALVLTASSSLQAALVLGALALAAGLVLRWLGYLRVERAPEVLAQRRRNLELRAGIREIAQQLRNAAEVDHVWESVQAAVPKLGAEGAVLHLTDRRVAIRSRRFDEHPEQAHALLRTRHQLAGERPGASVLEFAWNHGRTAIDRDTEMAVEVLCRHVQGALTRIEAVDAERQGEASLAPANEPAFPAYAMERSSPRGGPRLEA